MKKRYTFLSENWLRFGLAGVFTVSALTSDAQIAPAKVWDKTFGGSERELFTIFQQTSDGGYILGGSSDSDNSGEKSQNSKGGDDYWVVKLDSNGNKLWDATYGGSNLDNLTALQQTSDGGYILGGFSFSNISGDKTQDPLGGNQDYWIVKIDASGNKQWDKTFGGINPDQLHAICQTSDGGYFLGGTSRSGFNGDLNLPSQNGDEYWVIKLDSYGNKLWDKNFGGSEDDNLTSLQQTLDGGYILGGYSESGIGGDKSGSARGNVDYWILKIDSVGNKIWDKTYGGNKRDELTSVRQTSDGSYIVAGVSDSDINNDKSQSPQSLDVWLLKLDTNGNKVWDKTFGGAENEWVSSVDITSDGGYIFGTQKAKSYLDSDCWIIKLDSLGNIIWDQVYGGNLGDGAPVIKATSDGGYFIGTYSFSDAGGDKTHASRGKMDFWVIKLGENPKEEFSATAYPNPNSGSFRLKLNNLSSPKVSVFVYNELGREILRQEFPVSGSELYKVIDLPTLKGIYFVKVQSGKEIESRKIVIK